MVTPRSDHGPIDDLEEGRRVAEAIGTLSLDVAEQLYPEMGIRGDCGGLKAAARDVVAKHRALHAERPHVPLPDLRLRFRDALRGEGGSSLVEEVDRWLDRHFVRHLGDHEAWHLSSVGA